MAVQNVWWWQVRPWIANSSGSWSMRVTIPAQRVYAFAAMQYFGLDMFAAAFGGVSAYTTNGTPHPVGMNQRNGVVPGIFDNNVDSVTFTWGLSATNLGTGGVNQASADLTFQIFGWG